MSNTETHTEKLHASTSSEYNMILTRSVDT